MKNVYQIGFLSLLVIAGGGLVMATYGGQAAGNAVEQKGVGASVNDVCPGCGNELGTCGSDCKCGCQDDKCAGGCGKLAGTCDPTCGCGCQDGVCTGDCGKSKAVCGAGCGCSKGG